MSKERNYGWNGEMPAKELSGQALIVFNGLKDRPDELHTGHEWTELIGKELKTRQDAYRVVLYYILILKNKGVIRTEEFDINAVTKKEGEKRGITVESKAAVKVRHAAPIENPDEIAEELQEAVGAALDNLGK